MRRRRSWTYGPGRTHSNPRGDAMHTTATASRTSAPTSLPPVGVVAAVYEAFGRGDVPGVLALCADDVVFDDDSLPSATQSAGHPLFSTHRGKTEVREFFAALATYDFGRFEVLDLMVSSGASPDPASEKELVHVAARVLIALTPPAGNTVEDDEMHLW